MEKVKLTEKMLVNHINSGMTRPQIAKEVGLSVGQLNQALKMKGLDKMRAKTVKFEFVEDEEAGNENIVESPIMEGNVTPILTSGNGLAPNTMFDEKTN